MLRKTAPSAIALLLLLPSTGSAGAWVQPEGQAYLRVLGGYLETDERFDNEGGTIPFNEDIPTVYRDFAAAFYGELGITPEVTIITDIQWKRLVTDAPGSASDSTTTGFGDAGFGIKLGVGQWNTTVASIGAQVIFPTGYDPDAYPALGSDVTEFMFNAQVGDASIKSWINGEAWFRLRGGDFRDQVGGALGLGFDVVSPLSFRGETRGVLPLGEPRENNDPFVDPADFDPSYLDLAATLSLRVVRGLAVEIEGRHTIGGRNTLRGTRWSLGFATSPAWRLWQPVQ